MIETRVDLLRHGRCEGGEMVRGSTDVALTEDGWNEMRLAVASTTPWSHVVTSPMQRCQAFATELCDKNALPLSVIDDLREINFGQWEGRQWPDIASEQGDMLRAFWNMDSNTAPPDGESLKDFGARVVTALEQVVEQHAGKHLLIVCHGGVIRMLLGSVLHNTQAAFSWAVPYANLSRLQFTKDQHGEHAQIVFHNRQAAL